MTKNEREPNAYNGDARQALSRAGLYLRQSMDRDGRAEGIDRQRARCRKRAEERGWIIVDEYVDNDVSATKRRGIGTAWHRLIEDAKAGKIDIVVAVDQDRILRGIRDLVTLIDVGVRVSTIDGELDLTTADGEFRATLAAGLARFEVQRKSERQRRANAHRREKLLPPGGRRAFGYTALKKSDEGQKTGWGKRIDKEGREWPDYGHEPLEAEAAAVRGGFAMLLAGTPLRGIARAWNDAGLTTTSKHPFEAYSVRNVLSNPRYAGLIAPPRSASSGQSAAYNLRLSDLPVGSWEPIVSPETWAAARDLLADPARRTNPGAMPRTLLSGIATCGVCGSPMKAGVTRDIPNYRCSSAPHLARKREDADFYVTHVVLERLAQPDAADAILRRPDAPDAVALRAELLEAKAGEANVLALVGQGLTTMNAATATLREIREKIARIEAGLSDAGRVDVLGSLVESADAAGKDYTARWEAVAEAWAQLDGDRQRAVVRKLVAIVMRSPGKGSRTPRDRAGRLAHTAETLELTWL